jgi:hypothetical protein
MIKKTDRQKYSAPSVAYTESIELESSLVPSRVRGVNKKIKKTEVAKMPSKIEMAKNLAKSASNITKAAIAGEGLVASTGLVSERITICKACPWFVSKGQRCSKCGCVVPLKAYFSKEKCPVGRW